MITVGMNYEVIEGKGPEFEKVFYKVLDIMNATPGHSESDLYKKANAPNSYLIVSEWSDRSAFDAFTKSDQFANVVDWGKTKILSTRPKHEIYGTNAAPATGCPAGAH